MPNVTIRPASRSAAAFFVFMCLGAVLFSFSAGAGEGDQAQPYEKIRYPTYADGRLQSLLEADQAEAYDMTLGTPRINLRNVVITLYEDTEETRAATPEDQPLPVKMYITSDRGYFTRRPPEPGAPMEEIANLEGNVVVRQMRIKPPADNRKTAARAGRPSRLPPGVETEIHCEHAQWNNTLRKLNGDGEVEFIHEDSTIHGTGFLYLADDDALDSKTSSKNIKDWGGIVFIEHNARMEINNADGQGNIDRTEITCRDTASYKLREREIQFERDVKIRRRGLIIESDILKVFLCREDEPLPETTDKEAVPGQVKNIVATIGNRPGSVVITGYKVDEKRGTEVMQFHAKGGRADFDYDSNRITLTDTRENRRPEVEFGVDRDRITDGSIVFVFKQEKTTVQTPASGLRPGSVKEERETTLETLTTSGGKGEVVLRSRRRDGDSNSVPGQGPTIPTIINYRGEMSYNRHEGRIRFETRVYLKRADLTINSELLDVRLISDGVSQEPNQVNRILAETDVVIKTGVYQAKAQRAEYDVYSGEIGPPGSGLDTLRLFGPPRATPPHPWIRDQEGNQITAPEIHMQRLTVGPGQRDQHLMVARGGVSVCDFVTKAATAQEKAKVVSIKCERGMEYNQANRKARFIGQVMATSDSPEDNYVLTSDRLVVDFEETPKAENPDEFETWIRRITAEGNARLMQDVRICEAINIIRDFPTSDPKGGDIYLQGALPSDGRPPQMAVYREQTGSQIGSMFAAPLIKSTSRGDVIQANGPGQLSTPDETPGARAEIHFEGAASYEMQPGGQSSEARFWGGVKLTQPSQNVMVTADEMDARFIKEDKPATFGGQATDIDIERIGRLRRVEGRNNVRLTHVAQNGGQRVAVGDVGVVEFTPSGNILRLTADRSVDSRRFVMTRDHDGKTLRAPEVEIREAQGITRASGPGDLQLPANSQGGDGMSAPTRILYGERGSLVYNELALNIRVNDSVRLIQPGPGENWNYPSLDGLCDRVEILLFEPPAAGMTGDDALSRVQKMDAIGNVVLRVYADAPPDNPNMDWLSRPGTTFFVKGDLAEYNVPSGEMSVSSNPPRKPELLLNMVEGNDAPRRQRLRADRFVLHNNARPRRWNYIGELKADAIRDGEPFEFTAE